MKRLTIITLVLLAIVSRVSAQESVSVSDILVPQGGEAFLEINYSLEGTGPYVGFMFLVNLPEGLSLAEDEEEPGYPWYDEEVSAISGMSITATPKGFAATPKTATAAIDGNSGVQMRVKVAADASLAVGSSYTGKITNLSYYVRDESYNVTKIPLGDITFGITIDDDPDGIERIKNEELKMKNDNAIYNLAGQRLSKMQKGVNIVNSHKVLK